MKTKIVTQHIFEISEYEMKGILLRHLVATNQIELIHDHTTSVGFELDKVVITVINRDYKKS